jgi:hypothetical protein
LKRTRRLKSLLEHLLQCRCPSLQVCVERLSLSPNLNYSDRAKRFRAGQAARSGILRRNRFPRTGSRMESP